VACPFFAPVRVLEPTGWLRPPRMPLGDTYAGVCSAVPDAPSAPPEPRQRELCNRGYARGQCDRFPEEAPADAVRFSIIGEDNGRIQLLYVLERDHAPLEHGPLEFAGTLQGAGGREVLAAQARAFVASYKRGCAK
jgi:hypothetical protein